MIQKSLLEMIVLQAQFYHYGASYHDRDKVDSLMPWPFGTNGNLDIAKLTAYGTPQPDKYVITLAASMWW